MPLAIDHDTSWMTRPLRSRISPTWDEVTDRLNDDEVQLGSGKKTDKIYVDHRLESHSDRCPRNGDSQQRE